MASIKTCGNLLLICCGESVAVFDFRHPKDVSILSLPQVNVGHGKQKQQTQDDQDTSVRLPGDGNKPSPPNRVLAMAVSTDGQTLAVCDDQKHLHVFHNDQAGHRPRTGDDGGPWKLSSSRLVSRRCTTVRFTSDLQTILVADKSGDVFSFPTTPPPSTSPSSSTPTTPTSTSTLTSSTTAIPDKGAEQPGEKDGGVAMETDDAVDGEGGGGTLVLGHLSMLLDMILIDGDRYAVTADRDEKIRISCYPDAYNIHAYCLGHTAFVITLACDDQKKVLFSGSGDACVGLWNYEGEAQDFRHCFEDFPHLMDYNEETNMEDDAANEEEEEEGEGEDTKRAVQQVAYCPDSNLLFVSLYKCPHILIYRLTTPSLSPDPHNGQGSHQPKYSLQPVKTLNVSTTTTTTTTTTSTDSSGNVVCLCIRGSTLWVVREVDWPQLQLEAFTFCIRETEVVMNAVDVVGDNDDSQVLKAVSNMSDSLLKASPAWQDPIPTLWKSQTDGYLQEYMERKRQRVEGESGGKGERWGNKKRKGKKSEKKRKENEKAEIKSS